MSYLELLIEGKLNREPMDRYCHPHITENTEQLTAKTIFDSLYNEGNDYNYTQEPTDFKKAGKLLLHDIFYLFLIFGVTLEICILLLNRLNICCADIYKCLLTFTRFLMA